MENHRPTMRPEDRNRIPELYEVVVRETNVTHFTGLRVRRPHHERLMRLLGKETPFRLVPITFMDAPTALDKLRGGHPSTVA